MWFFTKHGFYSVVRKIETQCSVTQALERAGTPRAHCYHIRARLKKHLEALKQLADIRAPITRTESNDYRYRMVVSPWTWARVGPILVSCAEIDYSNFKSEVARRARDAYETALHRVWSIMFGVQEAAERPAISPRAEPPFNGFAGDAFGPSGPEPEKRFDGKPRKNNVYSGFYHY